ncbi:MAG TPA: hypothetical protein VKU60_07065, partial [Chloroflexota bacterium]|nr:hypothetical protein [Chloroflexota bacterium]
MTIKVQDGNGSGGSGSVKLIMRETAAEVSGMTPVLGTAGGQVSLPLSSGAATATITFATPGLQEVLAISGDGKLHGQSSMRVDDVFLTLTP